MGIVGRACFVALSVFAAASSPAFDRSATGGKDCKECHALTVEGAQKLLTGIVDRVVEVSESEVKGFWTVDVEGAGGRKGVLYVDYSKKYLLSGALVDVATKANLTQEHMINSNRVDFSKIPLGDAVVIGKPEAPNKVVIFDDPECPFCVKLHTEVKKVVETRPDVAFYVKMFPLAMHPTAKDKAKAILCGKEKAAQLLEDSFAGKPLPPATCETNQVEENIKLAGQLGITGTPALVFPDGRVVPGFRPADKILEYIDGAKAPEKK